MSGFQENINNAGILSLHRFLWVSCIIFQEKKCDSWVRESLTKTKSVSIELIFCKFVLHLINKAKWSQIVCVNLWNNS